MSWFRMESAFSRHRKNRRLAELLGLPLYAARGLVNGLFCQVCAEAPDGCLADWTNTDIAYAADWDGEPNLLVSSLIEVRFLIDVAGNLEINDWMEYAAGYKSAVRARKYRDKRSEHNASRTRHARECDASHAGNARVDHTSRRRTDRRTDKTDETDKTDRQDGQTKLLGSNSNRESEKIQDVWDHYRSFHPHAPSKLKSGRKEYRLIKDRLEDFTVDALKKSIDGYHKSDWHTGKNDNGKKYLSIELIMRDISHVQSGLRYLDEKKKVPDAYAARPDLTNWDPLAKYRDETEPDGAT